MPAEMVSSQTVSDKADCIASTLILITMCQQITRDALVRGLHFMQMRSDKESQRLLCTAGVSVSLSQEVALQRAACMLHDRQLFAVQLPGLQSHLSCETQAGHSMQ